MASAEIKVTAERLLSARDVISAEAGSFSQCMEQISNDMRSLDAVWEGSSASEFLAQFNKLKSNFDAYKGVIDEQANALSKTAEFYEQRENAIMNETSKLSNSDLFAN